MLSHISHVWLCDPMDYSQPGSSIHEILQARIQEWVAMPPSRGSSKPRDWTPVSCGSCTAGGFFTPEPPGKPKALFTAVQKLNSCVCSRCLNRRGFATYVWTTWSWVSQESNSDEAEGHVWEDIYHVFSKIASYELMCRLLYYYKYTHTHTHAYALIRLISHLWVITSILSFSPLFVCSCVFFWRRYLVLCNKKWRTAGAQRGVQFSQSGLIGMNHSSLNLSSASLGRVHHDPGLCTGRWREIRQTELLFHEEAS